MLMLIPASSSTLSVSSLNTLSTLSSAAASYVPTSVGSERSISTSIATEISQTVLGVLLHTRRLFFIQPPLCLTLYATMSTTSGTFGKGFWHELDLSRDINHIICRTIFLIKPLANDHGMEVDQFVCCFSLSVALYYI